jgi:uncharacterized protein (DUF1697 family)
MKAYVLLLRGINVGGKNKVPMSELKKCLEDLGFSNVSTYIASGNAIVQSDKHPDEIKALVEAALTKNFKLDSELIKVLVLSHAQLKKIVDNKPKGFGEDTATYYSDAVFLIGINAAETMPIFSPREGVDVVWPGEGVIYSQRLGAMRTKSRLSKIMMSPLYKSMTIRSWNTTAKLLKLLEELESHQG